MKSQETDIVIKVEHIIGSLIGKSNSQHDFVNLVKELTMPPFWLSWHLEWWQEEGNFVSRLSSRDYSFFITIIPISKFYAGEKIIGFEFGGIYNHTGLDERFYNFKVDYKSDDFPILHEVFLRIQSRWNDYLKRSI